ncbi:MAG: LLM class flavin-dependent oxidoreductase [Gammaproteobacteria bacterium]|nr:MAG: LLM class flavin-dependent oxidoreductase [Gammaproteobacteria bacterium]
MRSWFFTETAYPYLPPEEEFDSIRVKLPNQIFDPKKGADLYHRYIDEWVHADEIGLDIMVNEHHQTATCMDPAAPIMLGILARETKNAKLLLLGNPIVNRRDPVRVAEEMAMVDNISRGRVVVGFVRGVPYEISAMNSNPVGMHERLWEAHDLIIKAWTTHDGPFNWESEHFHYRQVNIWPRPYQAPHPPVWITALSPGSVARTAEKNYVAATFLTGFEKTREIFDAYRSKRAEMKASFNNDRLAYAALIYTGETDEEGFAGARKLMWYITANKVPIQFNNPPGYASVEANVAMMKNAKGPYMFGDFSLETLIEQGIIFAGSPDTVYKQIKKFYGHVGGFGHLLIMGQAGFLEHDETVKGMDMFAKEVYPRLKELNITAETEV